MVKVRETFHHPETHRIHSEQWFAHVAETRSASDVAILKHTFDLLNLAEDNLPNRAGISSIQFGLAMADMVDNLRMDVDSVAAAMIYPTFEQGELALEDIQQHSGESVAKLVQGVQQMDAIRLLYDSSDSHHHNPTQIDNIRKMLLAMVEDVRVVLIKLTERTVFMRCMRVFNHAQQQQHAKATRDIYAPLANRLGVAQIKWELEDYAFRYLEADTYKKIAKAVALKREEREKFIKTVMKDLESHIGSHPIKQFEVTGRAKHIYSIYKKMQRKNVDFEQIYDASAVRVLVPKEEDCYTVLGIAHALWTPIPEEFDDYINNPKPNGYRSLHTAVIGPQQRNVEIQIRTYAMHEESELGVAAHWVYKEGGRKRSSYDEKIAWLRQLMDWQQEVSQQPDNLDANQGIFDDRVYVFSPAGEIVDLPQGATPLDFAYHIHTEVGHRCRGAKISGKIVPLTYSLQTGDRVEILTAKEAHPSRDWLNPHSGYLKSSRAKAKILHWFKKQDHHVNAALGKELFDKELKKLHISRFEPAPLLSRFSCKSMDDLWAAIGAGTVKMGQVIHSLELQAQPQTEETTEQAERFVAKQASNIAADAVDIQGIGNLLYHMASCCKPIPGDEIIGFITQGRGVSIHRRDCQNILSANSAQQQRFIEVNWGKEKSTYPVDIFISAFERQGLVRDVSQIIVNEKINLLALNTTTNKKEHTSTIAITLEIPDLNQLSSIMERIKQLPNVQHVERQK